mmetsp:Transcript_3260/g.7991  ORF Transcript_3260/g.7991 Transcript_3260/m.7991 type:complete len:456 (+) Transcript_3260:193-1560(+)
MVKGGQALIANFYNDGVTYAGRVASLCVSLGLALLIGARFSDEFGWIQVNGNSASLSVNPYLTTVNGVPVEKIELGWKEVCRFPVTESNLSSSSNLAPICEKFRHEHIFDLSVLGSAASNQLCDSLSFANYCPQVQNCEITWFVAAVLALIGATFSEKSTAVGMLALLASVCVAINLGYWDETLKNTVSGFDLDYGPDNWGTSFRLMQTAVAVLVLATIFAILDCTTIKDPEKQYGIMNDGIEITGRAGIVLGIFVWVLFACGYGSTEWFATNSLVSDQLAVDGLNTSKRFSFGLTQWCAEQETDAGTVEYCMWYKHDPWGEQRRTACDIFTSVDLCTKTFQGRIILMSAIVLSFIVDIYSEKMLLNAIFGLFSGIMGLYVLISMEVLAKDIEDEYFDGAAEDFYKSDGWYFVLFGVIFSGVGFVLCLLDWCDCCGMKDSCWILHCGTAGRADII